MADPIQPTSQADGAGSVLPPLYKDPRPLDFNTFGKHGLKSSVTLGFARANSLPITASEFQLTQMFYPIVFVGEPMMPICVLGFQTNENLFLSRDGNWDVDTYVPGYVRRYPFVLAELPGDDRRFLCADYAAEGITDKNPELPFFGADGKATEIVTKALEFCRQFQEDVIQTQAFCNELKANNLLKQAELKFNLPDGSQQGAGVFTTIDTAAVDVLPDSVFLDFRKRGLLPLIYMQQLSLNNWGRLNVRRERLLAANSR